MEVDDLITGCSIWSRKLAIQKTGRFTFSKEASLHLNIAENRYIIFSKSKTGKLFIKMSNTKSDNSIFINKVRNRFMFSSQELRLKLKHSNGELRYYRIQPSLENYSILIKIK